MHIKPPLKKHNCNDRLRMLVLGVWRVVNNILAYRMEIVCHNDRVIIGGWVYELLLSTTGNGYSNKVIAEL